MTHTLPSRRRTEAQPVSIRSTRPETQLETTLQTVPGALPAVPRHWAVFHPLPGAAHLVVGPGGIFTICVQHLAGDWAWADKRGLLVSGHRVAFLAEAERQADRFATLLRTRMAVPAPVRPVLALEGARYVGPRSLRDRPLPVKVLAADDLEAWLAGLPTVLRAIERMELAAVIDSPVTWGIRPTFGPGLPPRALPLPRPPG
ncbi:NERD domain-containing protein [Cryobacterium frigoriphilum]|uniref:NERD domain-containing protein n=1 Tax=Cryobacterium frigoriphilum TaxID=1259150 RepID=A0A4R9A6I4_9MICO|nr:nuclease-related domain-containing protein [Cryobacterium frigoriphilum]TFD52751.1 NERD domain-containing protein [Cryobacterium frigoriphilum]